MNNVKTLTSGKTTFVKVKESILEDTPMQASSSAISHYTTCNKRGYDQSRYYSRLFNRFQLYVNKLVNEYNLGINS